jgi:uncharacterized membrane-anchored protein YitT (DUF2179 family)
MKKLLLMYSFLAINVTSLSSSNNQKSYNPITSFFTNYHNSKASYVLNKESKAMLKQFAQKKGLSNEELQKLQQNIETAKTKQLQKIAQSKMFLNCAFTFLNGAALTSGLWGWKTNNKDLKTTCGLLAVSNILPIIGYTKIANNEVHAQTLTEHDIHKFALRPYTNHQNASVYTNSVPDPEIMKVTNALTNQQASREKPCTLNKQTECPTSPSPIIQDIYPYQDSNQEQGINAMQQNQTHRKDWVLRTRSSSNEENS